MAKSRAPFDHFYGPSSQTIDPGRRPAAHLAELLTIAFVPVLSELFDLRPIEPPDMGLTSDRRRRVEVGRNHQRAAALLDQLPDPRHLYAQHLAGDRP